MHSMYYTHMHIYQTKTRYYNTRYSLTLTHT